MKPSDQVDSRLAQFRASLRLQSARRAFDVLLEYAPGLPGYRFGPAEDEALNEFHYVDEASGQRPFTLGAADGELLFDVHEAGFNQVPGGLPALEAGLGPVSATDSGVWRLHISRPAQADALSRLLFSREQAAGIRLRHWWLNLTEAESSEIEGGYLWSSKQPGGAGRKHIRSAITSIVSGDAVFAHADGSIVAIGVVLDPSRSAPDPKLTGSDGWLVPVRFVRLNEPVRADRSFESRRGRSTRHSAGEPYLSEVPEAEAHRLRRLLSRLVEDLEQRIATETDGRLQEQAIEEHIWQRTDIAPVDKRQLSFARAGQGVFREHVERIETACRVTGILDRRYLRATHIKPWKDASDEERLDGANGLLLSPHIIHLFDRGHISFADDGSLLISRHLNPYVRKAWNLEYPVQPRAFRSAQRAYLDYHRIHVFERVSGGRRAPGESA
jgi:putative restriction endonuclease